MSPRIRHLLLALLLTALVVPAGASAASPFAGPFSSPSTCVADSGPWTLTGVDTTAPPSGWQQGSPAGQVDVPLTGTGVDAWEYKIDCATTQSAASGVISVTGDGTHTVSHRAQQTGGGAWTPWVDDTVQIDHGVPTNTSSPSTGWQRGPYSFSVTGTDSLSTVGYEWRDGSVGPFAPGPLVTVTGTGTHTVYTAVVDAAGNRNQRSDTVRIDNALPSDTTVTPVGWQHNVVDVTVTGNDADSGLAYVGWEVDGGPGGTGPDGTVLHITTQGSHTVKTRAVDNAGNDSGWTTHIVQVDINGPADTTGASVPSGWVRTPSVTVSAGGTDAGGRGVTRIEWNLDNGFQSGDVAVNFLASATTPVVITGDGVHVLKVRLTDGMGDITGWNTYTVRIDTVTPVDTTAVSSGWTSETFRDVTVGGTDADSGVNHVDWKLDGVAGTALGTSKLVHVADNGEHVLETRVVDAAGNVSAWVPRTIRLDSTAPDNLTPTIGSTGWRTTAYSVVLNGSDSLSGLASVAWRVDGGPVSTGTAQIETATVTGNGVHALETRVRDLAGNYSGWRAEAVNIDNVAPADTTVYPGSVVPNGRKVPVTGTDADSGVAGVQWQLDNGEIKTSSPATILGAGGSHVLKTRVQDNAGNWSAWRSGTVTINAVLPMEDTDAPTDTTSIPVNWRTSAYTVTVSGDDNGGTGVDYIEWRLDGNAVASGSSNSTFSVSTDGVHDIETRVWDLAGNHSDWRSQTLKIDRTLPVITTSVPAAWTHIRVVTLSATDATSGVDKIEYTINGGATQTITGASGAITLSGEGDFLIRQRVYDVAGQLTAYSDLHYKIDTVDPANTTAAAPTGWQTAPLSLALTGTDAASGVDHGEWRVDGGTVHTTSPAVISTQGTQLLETRVVDVAGNVSAWSSETIKLDTVKPVNTTPTPATPWRNTNYSVSVTGSDALPGSGLDRVEYKLDGPTVLTTSSVAISAEGTHTLQSRVIDLAGNASDWRTDAIGIDKTVPSLAVDCGPQAWRNTPATCAVTATGGPSGLPTLTGQVGSAAAATVVGAAFSVDAEGTSALSFRAVDGAGNENLAAATVRIDRTPPAPAVNCAPGTGTSWSCTASAVDAQSGVAALAYSVDGSPPVAPGAGGAFSVAKGSVTVYATDVAGNGAASPATTLTDRTPPPPPPPAPAPVEEPTPRVHSEAVLLRKGGAPAARLVGQLAISALPSSTTVDLRPLAIGKGTFQFVFKVTVGRQVKTYTRTQVIKTGYSSRIRVVLGGSAKTSVTLAVRRKAGRRWTTYATATATL